MTKKAATTSKSATTRKSAPIKKGASRFPVLTPETLTKEQTKMLKSLLSGPRGGGDVTKASMNSALNRGPFNAWLRSPELGDRLQKVGEYIRFGSSMPRDLNEMAILITARYWTSQFEWFAHSALAIKAGLDPKIIDALAKKKRPSKMTEQQASVYEFCTQLHHKKKVQVMYLSLLRDVLRVEAHWFVVEMMSRLSLLSVLLCMQCTKKHCLRHVKDRTFW
jgi:alkylhydroperoxidase family enzyme